MESFEQCIVAFSFNIVGLMFKENTIPDKSKIN